MTADVLYFTQGLRQILGLGFVMVLNYYMITMSVGSTLKYITYVLCDILVDIHYMVKYWIIYTGVVTYVHSLSIVVSVD